MVNSVTLIGRIGTTPIAKEINGQSNVTFTMATTEGYKDKQGNRVENTEWHNVQAWRGLADVISKYCKKGDLIYISGKIHYRTWETDGVKHYATDIIANEMKMLGGRREESEKPAINAKTQSRPYLQGENLERDEDDLPFD